jgi:predicted DNA-binding transcriptional regulator AlpA
MSIRLNVKGAAQVASLSVSFLNKLRVYGGGPRYSKIGRRVLYDQVDVEAWLADHKRGSTSDTG